MNKTIVGGLMLLSSAASAVPITHMGVTFNSEGNQFKHGSVYLDASVLAGSDSRGIGQVSEIRDASGSVLWTNGDNGVELNYWFAGYERALEAPFNGGSTAFADTGGHVRMITAPIGTFNPTGVWGDDVISLTPFGSYGVFLDLQGRANTSGHTFEGLQTQSGLAGNGLLDVIGGGAATYFDTNSLLTGADMYINLSTDTIATAGYDFSGSGDLSVLTAYMPIPGTLALLGLGFVGLLRRGRQ